MLSEEKLRLTEEHAALEHEIARVVEEVFRLQGTLDETGVESTRAAETFETMRGKAEAAERERDEKVRAAAAREMEFVRQQSELAEVAGALERLAQEAHDRGASATVTRERLAAGAAESDTAARRIEALQESLAGLQRARDEADAELGTLREAQAESQSAVSELETQLKTQRQALEEVTQSLHHEDVARVRAVSEAEQIRRRVLEERGVDLEAWDPRTGLFPAPEGMEDGAGAAEPEELRHPDELPPESAPDDDEEENWQAHLQQKRRRVLQLTEEDGALEPEARRARIRELRARMEAMGSLNNLAEAEYDTQRERLEFHQKQAEDLRTARADLLEAIRKINETAGSMFQETFELVQQKFQETFTKLFPGGEATLRLAGPDALEDDVEISARPRGKRLESIRLLSTGERALTAIALLFSLYLIKPSPVCLLDEVDAPLDDANLDRFLAMVMEMAQRTQFIVITHNQKTMQVADNLFGVTMEEPGISKIVSVRLNGTETGESILLPEMARSEDPAGAV
jgi:chromosome segregation protein